MSLYDNHIQKIPYAQEWFIAMLNYHYRPQVALLGFQKRKE